MKRKDIVTHEIYYAEVDIRRRSWSVPESVRIQAVVKILDCGRNVQQTGGGFRFGYYCECCVIGKSTGRGLEDFVYSDELIRKATEEETKYFLLKSIV